MCIGLYRRNRDTRAHTWHFWLNLSILKSSFLLKIYLQVKKQLKQRKFLCEMWPCEKVYLNAVQYSVNLICNFLIHSVGFDVDIKARPFCIAGLILGGKFPFIRISLGALKAWAYFMWNQLWSLVAKLLRNEKLTPKS